MPKLQFLVSTLVASLTWLAFAASGQAAGESTNRVVIYYANETSTRAAQSGNYQTLLSILRRSRNPAATEIAESILHDAVAFPATVAADIMALTEAARRWQFDLAVFTNALALNSQYRFYRAAADAAEVGSLPELPAAADIVLAASPLSRPEYLTAALIQVGAHYPDGAHIEAILITNSHGSPELALTPRVYADLSLADPDEVLAEIDALREGGSPPAWALGRGTDKRAYWQAVAAASGRYNIDFVLVFREACASGIASWAEYHAVPPSVGVVAHSGRRNIRYQDFDFAEIFGLPHGDVDLVGQITAGLRQRGIDIDRAGMLWFPRLRDTLATIHPIFYFLPLALWLLWYLSTRIAARRPV